MSLWKKLLRKNFTNVLAFAKYLELSNNDLVQCDFSPDFRLNIPLRLAEKCQKGTLHDPILRQFLPILAEKIETPSFTPDPLHEKTFLRTPRLLQKYQARSLFITSSACPMHCRFCFRREFPYEKASHNFDEELALIARDPSQKEILLSGGDPLSLDDKPLETLLQKIDALPHIKRIRFHTRFPIGIPERLDDSFLSILQKMAKQVWFIVHINHPLELDIDVTESLKRILKLGIPVLTQTVLLRGVNDSVETLQALFEKCADSGIMPYYLHQLDPVLGTSHFHVAKEEGKRLLNELSPLLPGYALPRYVEEIAGQAAKTPVLYGFESVAAHKMIR